MITVNLTIHPKYNLGDTVFVDSYDEIDEAVVIDYMIKTYTLEGKTELDYAYQVESKKGKYTVDAGNVVDTKQEAIEALVNRRWKEYKGKTTEEIAEILKKQWSYDWNKRAKEITQEMKKIIKKAGINN